MICGMCGCADSFTFKIDPKGNYDKNDNEIPAVFISCGNCGTLTGLDEVITEKRKE